LILIGCAPDSNRESDRYERPTLTIELQAPPHLITVKAVRSFIMEEAYGCYLPTWKAMSRAMFVGFAPLLRA
jgi:hypothetical protein